MSKLTKKTALFLVPLFAASFLAGLLTKNNNVSAPVEVAEADVGNYSTNASTYYNGITATSGKELAAQLHDLITSTHQKYTSYDDNGSGGYQKQTDQYYENGNKVTGYLYEFYSGAKWSNSWDPNSTGGYNREHCWCQSLSVPSKLSNTEKNRLWGESGGGADMHHLRPVEKDLNSTRGNNLYGEISNRDSYQKYPKMSSGSYSSALAGYCNGGVFEPIDSKKGDVARIILYVYIHYNSYEISDLFGSYGTTNGSGSSSYFANNTTGMLPLKNVVKTSANTESAAISLLLSWNTSDPVDDIEERRNEQVAKYQGNRNPFIDNSAYADMIWGSGTITPTVNSVTVSPSTLNLDLNGTTTGNLTATVNVSGGAAQTVTWSSSNTNVATVSSSSGVVTAVAKGTCYITATSTENLNKTGSCTVKVVDSSGGGGGGTTEVTASVTISSYATANSWVNGTKYTSISIDSNVTASVGVGSSNTGKYYTSGNEWRFYQTESATIVISVPSGYTLESVTFTFNFANTGQLNDSSGNAVSSGTAVSLSGTSATFSVANSGSATNGQIKFTAISVTYSYESGGGSSANLQSISLNTADVQVEFNLGDTFNYTNLVVTAYYDDETEDTVTPTSVSSPTMSSAGEKEITVTYTENAISKTATYTINVTRHLFASVSKTFHPGEIIVTSDITVVDDVEAAVTGFSFADNDYQFTYDDAASGGEETNKDFVESIIYNDMVCDLTVKVQRNEYVEGGTTTWTKVTDASTLSVNDVIVIAASGNTNYALSDEQKTSNRGAASITKSNNTITWNTSGTHVPQQLTLTSTSNITDAPSGSFGLSTGSGYLYAASSSANQLKTQQTNNKNGAFVITISDGVATICATASQYTRPLMRYNPNNNSPLFACYATDSAIGTLLEIYKKSGGDVDDPAENLANYIMYEDTNGQCSTKFDIANGYYIDLSSSDQNTFMTSNDYVIATARERMQAWANYLGKTIGVANAGNRPILTSVVSINNNNLAIIISLTIVSVLSVGGYFYFRRKNK